MTHMRYWALTLAVGICGAFIAIERFAFNQTAAVWIAFGVAVAATVLSFCALLVAMLRENHAFSGLSALAALVAGWTVIDTLVFNKPAALWVAFAAGLILLLLTLRSLALHETTIERVVHALERAPSVEADRPAAATSTNSTSHWSARAASISLAMRSWTYWLAHIGLALAGALVVLMTFALTAPGHHHAPVRWVAFAIGIGATCIALSALTERVLPATRGSADRGRFDRIAGLVLSASSAAIAIAMIVTMAVFSGATARWVAFALGCGLVGASLLAYAVHELTSERVRHELEIAEPAPAPRAYPTAARPAA